ncbi:hypothetical protein [Aneurinibacillus aneurinilyticus]|jgi:DNA-directed RNA polymerase subunit RPC12/RpoP|nr:hypothetical protein [Aneurinibacillus aneurinilyticus]MCI1694209.1 transcription initiation factor TFIIIB [Aneurinibacillus aneurinilyticus]MED0671319.1 transcription initiation factor TFIIIB [Aneurinibacillus aneurinilyticus]MED0707743.1 transcription initiation factor TFIIIB [Aneurinibacillus aneurinilyticus]MED0722408.1 transcription initiation factor TFIIIB [Aneurinibacillus aneurinilyticus]MED0733106.1 transcription initiation factor TFIIIB [Aneurinibacillus aneurinilyticus]
MNRVEKATECPKCGSNELGKGMHSGYASMAPAERFGLGSKIIYIICTHCGFIVEGYVEQPKRFKKR